MTARLEGVEAELAQLRAAVRELADREAIRDLIAGYGPAVDRGDSAAAAAMWTDDGVYDLGELGSSRGHDAIAALFEGETHQGLIQRGAAHLLGSPRITIEGDRATAVCHSCVLRWTGSGFEAYRVAANRWTLDRTDGGWRIAERVNRLLTGSAEARALLR